MTVSNFKKYRMKIVFLFSVSLILYSGCTHDSRLQKLWETDNVFKVPESVLFDAKNNRLYVSNIDGEDTWAADGKGSIGLLGTDGKVIAAEWIKGLNSPKGLGLFNGMLYVADISNLIVINISTKAIEKIIPIPGSSGLNDITIDTSGTVYISDSKLKKVFKVKNDSTSVYLENLKSPNGLLFDDGKLYLLEDSGLYLVSKDQTLSKITDGLEGGPDGVEKITTEDFIVSSWMGAIWYVSGNGTKELLLNTEKKDIKTADIGLDPVNRIIYVPTFWKNSVIAYKVK